MLACSGTSTHVNSRHGGSGLESRTQEAEDMKAPGVCRLVSGALFEVCLRFGERA